MREITGLLLSLFLRASRADNRFPLFLEALKALLPKPFKDIEVCRGAGILGLFEVCCRLVGIKIVIVSQRWNISARRFGVRNEPRT